MPRPGGGHVGHSKHHKAFGRSGHNRDLIQTSRKLNEEQERQAKVRAAQQEEMFGSVAEALAANRRKKRKR